MNSEEKNLFTDWVNKFTGELLSWARHKTSDIQTAEDLVQETFLAAAEKLHTFRNDSEPKTWLYGILNNKISDFYKSQSKKQKHFTVLTNDTLEQFFDEKEHWRKESAPHEWDADESHLLDNEEFNRIFAECLEELHPQWHACITMKFLEEKSPRVVCQELGISDTNYWQILHRAKLRVRNCLEKNWFQE